MSTPNVASTEPTVPASPAADESELFADMTRGPLAQLIRKPLPMAGLTVIVAIAAVSIIYPMFVDQAVPDYSLTMAKPSAEHWLGNDELGRSQLNRLIYGTRTSLWGALIALLVALVIGVPSGLLAGYRGGKVEALLSRAFDVIMSVPALMLALAMVAVLGSGLTEAMIAVGLIFSPQFFRLTRATAKSVREEPYVEAMVALGFKNGRIMTRHVLPNCVSVLAVQAAVVGSLAVQAEASLSFLGLGAQPPTASLGVLLSDGFKRILSSSHLVWPPGIVVGVVVLALSFLGDGLRDALQPPGRKKA